MTGDDRKIVIIGASTGGPRILDRIFRNFPHMDLVIIIIQHMPDHINLSLKEKLDGYTDMNVRIAEDGETIENGSIYIAPSGYYLTLEDNRTIRLSDEVSVGYIAPSVDAAMQSLVRKGGDSMAGVVLTGMGFDGAAGISHIKKIGGLTISQNMETSIIHSMPMAAFETGCVDYVLSPEKIRDMLIDMARHHK